MAMESSRKRKRDCPDLPPDTLRLILESLPIKARVRARVVCTAWSSALPDKAEPFPWLLRLPAPAAGHGVAVASPTMFFPSTGNSAGFELPFHRPGSTRCVGMQDGWIAVVDVDLGVKILDPFTGVRVDLPPLTTCPGVRSGRARPSKNLHDKIEYSQSPAPQAMTEFFPVDTFLDSVLVKIAFSTPGAGDGGEVGAVAVVMFWDRRLAYTAAGLGEWRWLETLDDGMHFHPERITDVVHGSGCTFLGLTARLDTFSGLMVPTTRYDIQVFDLPVGDEPVVHRLPVAGLHPKHVLRREKFPFCDVFCACLFFLDGTPHVVLRWWDVIARTDEMAVFVNDPGNPLGWRVAGDLQGRALLVGNGCAVPVRVSDGDQIGGDRVYFASKVSRFAGASNRALSGVGTSDLKSGSVKMVWKHGDGESPETGRGPTWFAPPAYFR